MSFQNNVPRFLSVLTAFFLFLPGRAQEHSRTWEEINRAGRLDQWSTRRITESRLLGGETKTLYELAPETMSCSGRIPFRKPDGFPFKTTNTWANILGVVKASTSVFPEKRDSGYCARLEVLVEPVHVIAFQIDVVVQGSLILADLLEPIRDTKSPYSKLVFGTRFSERPSALKVDYKAEVGNPVFRGTGLSPFTELGGRDCAEIVVLLQKRWEENGRIYALRVGTLHHRICEDVPQWQNGAEFPIRYGDIRREPGFEPHMDLLPEESSYYDVNREGRMTRIEEIGWAAPGETPTHLIIRFSASNGQAFYGGVGNRLWIDNIELVP